MDNSQAGLQRCHFTFARRTLLVVGTAIAAGMCSTSSAVIVIPTNLGGADAEVREEELAPNASGVPQGVNRGANIELATRIKDATGNPTSDRTSAIYLKFNIAGVTQANLDATQARLQLSVRNNNISESRQNDFSPMFPLDDAHRISMVFNVFGLTNFTHPNYDWAENALTWYNAPGITPDDPAGTSDNGTDANDPGKFNFNSDLTLLGQLPLTQVVPQNHLAVGSKVVYTDQSGLLHQLIQDAKTQGRTNITLVVATAMDGFDASALESETTQSTPQSMLNFNYLFNPKEQTTLQADPSYDPDSGGPLPPTGQSFFMRRHRERGLPGPNIG